MLLLILLVIPATPENVLQLAEKALFLLFRLLSRGLRWLLACRCRNLLMQPARWNGPGLARINNRRRRRRLADPQNLLENVAVIGLLAIQLGSVPAMNAPT